MNASIKKELALHIASTIQDFIGTDTDDLHQNMFNTDHYVIGYYQANEMLKTWGVDAFEAIEFVKEYEMDNFGEFNTKINSESIVNMMVYIVGEEVLQEAINEYSIITDDTELTNEAIEIIIETLDIK